MKTAQLGDRVQVPYVKRLQNGAVASSRHRAPLELTAGIDHPRLPGPGLALVGLAPGTSTTIHVPPERAYGAAKPARVHRLAHTRFAQDPSFHVGKWGRIVDDQGRKRSVRILEVRGQTVVVDSNHRGAGQTLDLEVELIGIQPAESQDGADIAGPTSGPVAR